MKNSQVLAYNMDEARTAQIRRLCLPAKIRVRTVSPDDYGLTLGELVEGKTAETPYEGERFTDELILFCDCSIPQLDKFLLAARRQKIAPIAFKAVLTPTSRSWNSITLREELGKEHQAVLEHKAAHKKG